MPFCFLFHFSTFFTYFSLIQFYHYRTFSSFSVLSFFSSTSFSLFHFPSFPLSYFPPHPTFLFPFLYVCPFISSYLFTIRLSRYVFFTLISSLSYFILHPSFRSSSFPSSAFLILSLSFSYGSFILFSLHSTFLSLLITFCLSFHGPTVFLQIFLYPIISISGFSFSVFPQVFFFFLS